MRASLLKNLRPSRTDRKHIKLAQRLVLHIAQEGLGPGDRLGTENEFAVQHDMSRATVRQALELLEREGFISRRQRHGTFVVRSINLDEDLRRLRGDVMIIMSEQLEINPEVNLAYFTSFQSIVRELGLMGFSVQVVCLGGGPAEDRHTIQRAIENNNLEGVCSFAVDAAPFSDLLAALPVVTVGGYRPTVTPWIGLDVQQIMQALINHLLDLNHRDIAVICGPWVDTTIFAEFVTSCRLAFEKRNLPFRRDRIVTAFEGEQLSDLTRNLLQTTPRPSAIVAEDSRVCHAVIDAAAQLQYRIPEDLSLVSIGQNVLSIVKPVPITTYVPDNNTTGKEIARLLAQRYTQPEQFQERIRLPGDLVIRDSTIRYTPRN